MDEKEVLIKDTHTWNHQWKLEELPYSLENNVADEKKKQRLFETYKLSFIQDRKKLSKNGRLIIHFPTSSGVSEWASAAELKSKGFSAEQVNKSAVRANGHSTYV